MLKATLWLGGLAVFWGASMPRMAEPEPRLQPGSSGDWQFEEYLRLAD